MAGADTAAYGVLAPGRFDQAILTLTGSLPQNLPQFLVPGRLEIIDALKLDAEGSEGVMLCPFQDANVQLWPRLVIIEEARGSWKTVSRATR